MPGRVRGDRGDAIHDMRSTGMRLFYSYAHEDEALRDQLEKHLVALRAQGVLSEWHDRKIGAGMPWREAIERNLDTAHVILLLISPDFLASPYCFDVEMQRALQRHRVGTARVVPVLLRPTDWQAAPFAELQAVPSKGKPVVSWPNRDAAFADVARHIRIVCEQLQQTPGDPSNPYSVARVGDWTEYETSHYIKVREQRFVARARSELVEKNPQHAVLRMTAMFPDGKKEELRFAIPLDRPFEDVSAKLAREAGEKVPPNARIERKPTGAGTDKLFIGERVYYTTWTSVEITVTIELQETPTNLKVWVCDDVPLDGVVKVEQDNPAMSMTMVLVDYGRARGKRR